MRQVAKKGLITVVATGGVLAATGGYAYADAGAIGNAAGSPGVLSGNNVQVPVHVPVNLCGDTVDVLGVLNPAFGNHCANTSRGTAGGAGGSGAHATATRSPGVLSGNNVQVPIDVPVNACGDSVNVVGALNHSFDNRCANTSRGTAGGTGGSGATSTTTGSPGVGSGNSVQVPVHVPVNLCGDTIDVVGVLNPVFGNSCENRSTPAPVITPRTTPTSARHARAPKHRAAAVLQAEPTLAHTGAEHLGLASAASAGMLLGGFVLYRRGRALRR